jgi:hypothetical protein
VKPRSKASNYEGFARHHVCQPASLSQAVEQTDESAHQIAQSVAASRARFSIAFDCVNQRCDQLRPLHRTSLVVSKRGEGIERLARAAGG